MTRITRPRERYRVSAARNGWRDGCSRFKTVGVLVIAAALSHTNSLQAQETAAPQSFQPEEDALESSTEISKEASKRVITPDLCGGGKTGITPGCDPCGASCGSPTGGVQVCWTCTGATSTRNCTPPLPGECGADGAPYTVQNDNRGRPSVITAVGKDRVTRTLTFTYPQYLTLIRPSPLSPINCVPDSECASIASDGECIPTNSTVMGGGYFVYNHYAMSFCSRYAPNFTVESMMDYTESTGTHIKMLTQMNNYQGMVRTSVSTPSGWAQVATIGSTSVFTSSFASPITMSSGTSPVPAAVWPHPVQTYLPELAKLSYFHNYEVLQLNDLNLSFPNFSAPNSWRYAGDALIGVGSYSVAQWITSLGTGTVLTIGAPEFLAVWGVLALVGLDIWQNEPNLRNASYYYLYIVPWCTAAAGADAFFDFWGQGLGLHAGGFPGMTTWSSVFCPH